MLPPLLLSYKADDTFWLIPTPNNPIAIKVKVLSVVPDRGYWVDEPVGLVSNELCVFATRELAEAKLHEMHKSGEAVMMDNFEWSLKGLRDFLVRCLPVQTSTYPDKEEGTDWFKVQEVRDDMETRLLVIGSVQDLANDFMYFDRADDEELSLERLNDAITRGVVTQELVVNTFSERLAKQWGKGNATI
jgi:hypothetical protein